MGKKVLAAALCATALAVGAAVAQASVSPSNFKAVPTSGLPYTPPASILQTTRLSGKPPRGKTIGYVASSAPLYSFLESQLAKAAAVVGWKVKPFFYTTSAATAVQSAVSAHVSAILGISLVKQTIAPQLAAAKAAHIPVFNQGTPESSEPKQLYYTTAQDNDHNVELGMAWIAKNSGGKANIVVFNLPSIPFFTRSVQVEQDEIKAVCPHCTLSIDNISITDFVAGKMGADSAAYLQAHPNVTYAAYQFGDMVNGVVPVLSSAGLVPKVKVVCLDASNEEVLQGIANHQVAMGISAATASQAYWQIDYLSAYFLKDGIGPQAATFANSTNPELSSTSWIIDKASVAAQYDHMTYGWPGPKNYQNQFRKLWHE